MIVLENKKKKTYGTPEYIEAKDIPSGSDDKHSIIARFSKDIFYLIYKNTKKDLLCHFRNI